MVTAGAATPAQPTVPPTNPTTVPVPTGLTGTVGATNVSLSWNAVSGATRYQAAVYNAAGTALVTTPAQPVSTTLTTQNIVGLATNTAYQFTVTATTAAGTSAESAKVSRTTGRETVAITSARWKANDFRVVGTSSATSGTVSVYGVNPGTGPTPAGTPLAGMANLPLTTAAAPATGTTFDARVRTNVPPNPGQVWVRTSNGAVSGPLTVTT